MSVSLRTHQDIARAFSTLGLSADVLQDKKDLQTALARVKDRDPGLVAQLGDVLLTDMKGKERERLAALIGTSGSAAPAPTLGAAPAGANAVAVQAANFDRKGRLTENVPEVKALLAQHGVKDPVDRPFERVLVHAAKIDALFRSEKDPDKLLDLAMGKDIRRHVFLLEGIAKLYGKIHKAPAEAVHAQSKKLEDQLGVVSLTRSNLEMARKVGADPKAIAALEGDKERARAALRDLIVAEWMPDAKGRIPAMTTIVDLWGEADWKSSDKDIKSVRKELSRRLEKLENTPHDMDILEDGIHELRRQLRWFPIYAESLNGVFQLNDAINPVPAYEKFLALPIASSKYTSLPGSEREQSPIQLSKSVYCALMQTILDLGGIKDSGEAIHFLREAYVRVGLAPDDHAAEKLVDPLFARTEGTMAEAEIHATAHALYNDLKKHGLVAQLRSAVENG
jgi:hypothetical protein